MTRTQRSARQLASAIAALGAIAAILTIPPWALTRFVGWPLPTALPSVGDLTSALRAPVSDEAVVNTLACACWIAWALLAACLVTEIISTVTHRVATAVPLAGLIQPLARQLVVSATLLLSAARPAVAATRPPAAPVALALQPTAPGTPPSAEVPQRSCVVAPRDSLWRLAERHLGNGLRWREIWELNRDRTMTGGRTFHNPNLIRPGWKLVLPPLPEAAQPAPPPAPTPTEEPDPPDPQPRAPKPFAPAAPQTTAPPLTAPPVTAPPATAPVASTGNRAAHPPASDEDADDHIPVPAALAGATLVAAGIIGTLGHLRRRQQRHRTPGHTILTPKAAAAKAERQLRTAADTDGADRLDLALRILGGLLAGRPGADDTRIEVVQVDGDAIEILLTQPVVADAGPFDAVGGRLWRLPSEVPTDDLARQAADRGCLAPALVSIGHRNGTQVLIDLEHPDPLLLEGDDAATARVLTSLALDLATNAWADDVRILAHGDVPDSLADLDRIEAIRELDQLPELLRPTNAVAHALDQLGYSSTWAGRLANSGEGWPPTIVFLGPGTDQFQLNELLPKASLLPGLAVVASVATGTVLPSRRRLQLRPDGEATLQPLGLELSGTGVDQDLLDATAQLLGVAQSLEPGDSVDIDAEPAASDRPAPGPPGVDGDPIVPGGPTDPDRIIVRVLGPVEIEGGASPVTRRKSRELIVLLALHPKGRTEAQIKDALWPDELPKANTFNQTVSRARTALGTNQAEELHIPHVTDGCYRISPHVVTDADLLEQTLRQARANPDDKYLLFELSAQVAEAKAPFEGTKGYEWAYEKALPARMSAILDEAQLIIASHSTQKSTKERSKTATNGERQDDLKQETTNSSVELADQDREPRTTS